VGEELLAGDIVLAGGSTHVPVGHVDHVVAEIDHLDGWS
jgi:2-keto-4-pentenoate hydratase